VTSEQAIYLVILATCTVASGFFSGSETALIGISKERVHRLAAESKAGRRIEQLLANPERMLSTLLVANNVVNVLAAAVATTLFIGLVGETWGPWLATAAVTAVILVFGERDHTEDARDPIPGTLLSGGCPCDLAALPISRPYCRFLRSHHPGDSAAPPNPCTRRWGCCHRRRHSGACGTRPP